MARLDVGEAEGITSDDAGDTTERFGLFWPGKNVRCAAQDPTTATSSLPKS